MNYADLVREDRVHRLMYVDGDLFADEMARIFGRTWVYLAHTSEIPNPNDYKVTFLGPSPLILTRDPNGALHAMFNRCSHRGTLLCLTERGNARSFTCSYDGWTYSNGGELTGVPFPSGTGSMFDRATLGLQRLAQVDTFAGFIFGTLSADAPALRDHLGKAAAILEEWVARSPQGEVVLKHGVRVISARANWKLYLDGAADGLHPLFTHRSYLELSSRRAGSRKFLSEFRRDPDTTEMYSQVLENGHQFLDQRPTRQPSRWSAMPAVPGTENITDELVSRHGAGGAQSLLEKAAFAAMNIFIFPNLSIVENSIGVVRPLSVNRTEVHWYRTTLKGGEPATIPLQMRLAEESDNFIDVDDIENWERAQEGLDTVPEAEWVHTGRGLGLPTFVNDDGIETVKVTNEAPMRAYQEEWRRLMCREGASP